MMLPTCSCCSDRLIRHIRQGSLYWWCHSCWAEMPNMEEVFGLSTDEKRVETPTPVPMIQISERRLCPTLQEQLTPAKRPISIHRSAAHRVA
jgi:hypothetical protein